MEAPKVKFSDAVKQRVNIAMRFGGKTNKIDHKDDYAELQRLLRDIEAGKVDKNMIEEDTMYVKGLCMEYEKRYLGEPQGQGESQPTPEAKKEEEIKPAQKEPEQKPQAEAGSTAETPVKPEEKSRKNPFDKPNREDKPIPENKGKPKEPVPSKTKPQPPTAQPPQVKARNSGNNVAGEKAVVVTGDNNTVIVNGAAEEVGKTGKAGAESSKPTKPKKLTKEKMLAESKQNYNAAMAEGEQVAEDLIGPTNTKEKENAIRTIMKQKPGTIMGFIDGFNKNDTVLGIKYGVGGLIDQIDNEYGWTDAEKQTVSKHIILTTLQWAKTCGYTDDKNYKSLNEILSHLNAGKPIDTERADMLVKELISLGKTESGV